MSYFLIVISLIFVNNYVMSQFYGICPFLGVSKKIDTAIGMGAAVTFVMCFASVITYLLQTYLLDPFGLSYMQTITFILVIASLVQFVEMVIQKLSPALYQSLGIYLPLITTNCAVLGAAIQNIDKGYNLIQSLLGGLGGALGFMLAIVLFAGIREKMSYRSDIAGPFQGFPIALISAGLMSIAFYGFQGLI